MRRLIWSLVPTLVFLPMFVLAQRHGGVSVGGGRAGVTSRAPVSGMRAPSVFNAPRFNVPQRGGFGTTARPSFGANFRSPFVSPNRYYQSRFAYGSPRWSYGYGYFGSYSVPYAAPVYVDPDTTTAYTYPPADITYSGVNGTADYNTSATYFDQNSQYQQSEIDRLENEVRQLRQDREAKEAKEAEDHPAPKTILVFSDQHTEAIGNYAVIGKTLWVFTEANARKIQLADLDIPATKKTNEDRGLDFRLPE